MSKTIQTAKIYWLIEKTGDMRQVWGPYSLEASRKEKGVRHAIICGRNLKHGQTLTRVDVQTCMQTGSIWDAE